MGEPTDFEQLARLHVAAVTGQLPPDLAHWLIEVTRSAIGDREKRHAWTRHIRDAARCISGSRRRRARELADIIAELQAAPGLVKVAWYPATSPWGHVQMALRIAPDLPASPRHLARLIDGV